MDSPKTIALITGANIGIGFEVAVQLLADPKSHVLLGSRSIEKGMQAVTELRARQLPGTIELQQLDLDSDASILAAAQEIEQKHGRLDALVNNAGIAIPEGSLSEQLTRILRTNVTGPAVATEALAPLLARAHGTVRIVNVTSGAGSIGLRLDRNSPFFTQKLTPYRVSKAAFNMVTACQTAEYESRGWKIFCYNPGFTVSNLGPRNNAEHGAQPTEKGAAPIVDMLYGRRDADHGKFVNAQGELPW